MNGATFIMKELYFDDLKAGDRFQSEPFEVPGKAIIEFAEKFDPQMFHLNPKTAERTIFKGLVASGWHTAAITMRLLVTSNLNLAGGAIGLGVDEMRFPKPVRPGDTLRLELEVVEIRPSRSKPDRGTARIRYATRNQKDEIVFTQIATVLVPKRAKKENIGDSTPKALASPQANTEKRLTQREQAARGR
jgi:acyl dehydratase